MLAEGNTLLNDEELEMLVILRMNRAFMDFMRAHYNHLSKNAFGCTTPSCTPMRAATIQTWK